MTAVLVVGGAGYIGSHACKALARAGLRPVVFDNLSSGHRWAVRWGPFEQGELSDAERLRAVMRRHRISAVMHFAALACVSDSMADPGSYFQNNVANTVTLLMAMQAEGVRHIVFSSSCASYGLPQSLPLSEDHPLLPVNPYGESKLMTERMLGWYGQAHDLRWLALRYFNAAGADPEGQLGEVHDPETHLIPLAIQASLGQRESISIFGEDYETPDGTAVRDYIHVADLAQAHVLGLKHLMDGGESTALNLGTGQGYSVRDVLGQVERTSRRTLPLRRAARRPGDPPVLVADASRARDILGWQPVQSDLDQIVDTAWRWHLRQHNIRPI